MEPNVSLILCKIILFTQFKLKTGSYEAMKTITKSCYGQNEGFRNKYSKEQNVHFSKNKNELENAESQNTLMTKPENRIRKVLIRLCLNCSQHNL